MPRWLLPGLGQALPLSRCRDHAVYVITGLARLNCRACADIGYVCTLRSAEPTFSHILRRKPVEAVKENGHTRRSQTERMVQAREDLVVGDGVGLASPVRP